MAISRLMLEDLGKVAGVYDATLQLGYPRNVVKLEQIMDAPCHDDDIWMLVESVRGESLMVRRCLNLVSIVNFRCSSCGAMIDWTCLRVDCCHETCLSHLRVALLSQFLEFQLS